MKKIFVIILFLSLFGGLIVYRRQEMKGRGSTMERSDVLLVETVTMFPVSFQDRVFCTADVEPEEKAAVVAKIPGMTVLEVLVREGDFAAKGDTLAVLDDSLLRQQLLQAEAVLGRARSALSTIGTDFDRIAALYRKNAVSRQQYDRMEGEAKAASRQVEEARAALNQLRIMHGYHVLEAPVSGMITARNIDPGDTVSQSPCFIISRQERVRITGGVPERSFPAVQAGDKVFVTLDAFPERIFQGEVSRVHPALDPATRTGKVEVLLPSEGRILPGMFARVSIVTSVREGFGLPLEAVGRMAGTGESVCYVVSGDRAMLRKIGTGTESGNFREVLSGLLPGEQVISTRSEKLRDGVPVKVKEK